MINNLHAKPPKWITSLRNMVETSDEVFGEKPLFHYFRNKEMKTYTYRDLRHYTETIGTALIKLDLSGKNIALIGDNHPFYTTSYLATVNSNATIVPLAKELAAEQITDFLRVAEVEAVFYSACFNGKIRALAASLPNVRYFFPFEPNETEAGDNIYSVEALSAMGDAAIREGDRSYLDLEIDMERCCSILFTSGTTGTSKGVMLSQRNLTAAVNSSCLSMSYDDENTFVSVLPPHHTYEMTCGQFGVINIGAQALINDSIKHVMKNFATYKPNALALVPLFLETMHKKIWDEIRRQGKEKAVRAAMKLNSTLMAMGIDIRPKLFGKITAAFGGNLKSIVCGGAPISPSIIKDFYHFGITVLEGYGITECSPLVAVNSPGHVRFHSVGTPVYGCDVRIDYDEGQSTGEILVKGENVMLGYYKNEEATAEVFTEDGYFRTGDIGYMDKENYIYITGRKKNVIILSNGKNVFPEELEEYLSKVPCITESVVVGRKSEDGKEEVAITAIIVPDMDHPSLSGKTPAEVHEVIRGEVAAVNKKLPSYKHMTHVEISYEPFEKNSSHKIKRYMVH